MLLPWVVCLQLSAEINGSLVLLAFKVGSLLYSVIALSHTCLLLVLCVCVYRGGCTHLALVRVPETDGERLDLKGRVETRRPDYYVVICL